MNPGEQLICAAFEGMSDAERIAAVSADPRGASAVLIALGDECERFAAGAPEKALALGMTSRVLPIFSVQEVLRPAHFARRSLHLPTLESSTKHSCEPPSLKLKQTVRMTL